MCRSKCGIESARFLAVVQWTERPPPKRQIQVRFLSAGPTRKPYSTEERSDSAKRRSSIGFHTNQGSVTLEYSIDGKPESQNVWLSESACNFGGVRPWFICPVGGESVAVLYLRAGRFACRDCQRIAYASQSDDLFARMWRRQQKAEAKLGPDWARPKGMHEATRERLLSIIWECEEQRDGALANYVARMMGR